MKINEIAVFDQTQDVQEAPIGMLKRAATGLAGIFSLSQKEESKVQSAVNGIYKAYKTYYTPTPEGKPTGENMLNFLQSSKYPIQKKYGGLTGLYQAVEKAKKLKKQKPNAVDPDANKDSEQPTNQTPDNRIQFPTPDEIKQFAGMYEALEIKADTVLSDQQVKDIIEFVVRDSYQDDKLKDLTAGDFTVQRRQQNKKQEKEQQTAKQTQTQTAQKTSADSGGLSQGDDGVWRFS